MKSQLETRLDWLLLAEGLFPYEKEYLFHPVRRWRFDRAFVKEKLAVEVEGGVWNGLGRHVRGVGFTEDCIKYNEAAILGWRVLRVTASMIEDGTASRQIRAALGKDKT